MEAAHRTALAKGEVGIVERKPAPPMKDFAQRFINAIETRCASKPCTVEFYAQQLARLLEFEPLANARLDEIDEALVESFVQHRSQEFVRHRTRQGLRTSERRISPATVNRGLATLCRLLRLAQEWRVIDRVPRIHRLQGERNRDFVLSYEQERTYLAFAPQPLKDIATLFSTQGCVSARL